ncbi:polysaccharide deacetylase family protein [Streptomyces longispororuber]|uniref:polysaccharide deacetylase family protein n=1 Tax=Streptomyces longispororuber TaxID=68230 RepID=UPI0036FF661A
MKDDQMPPGRRALLRGAAALGLAAATGCVGAEPAGTPGRAAATGAAASGPPAAGPGAFRARRPSAYRLRPMAGHAPARTAPAGLAVRRAPILRLPGRTRAMVLTFDDGPDPRYTPDILRTLRQYDTRAMFFVCGEMVAHNQDLLRQMADDGHVIGNHTWSHPLLPDLTRSAVREQLERTSEIVEGTVGVPPLWFRAPYGAWNRAVFELGAELGMEPLAWTVDTLDWRTPGTRTIVRRVLNGAGPGVVVLSHDAGGDRTQSVRALDRYLPELLASGFHLTVPPRPPGW